MVVYVQRSLPQLRPAVTEPYAMTNSDENEVIHDREVYDRANVVG